MDDVKLLRMNLHISVLRYLEERGVCFTEVEIEDNKRNKKNEDNQVAAIVSDSEEEKSK